MNDTELVEAIRVAAETRDFNGLRHYAHEAADKLEGLILIQRSLVGEPPQANEPTNQTTPFTFIGGKLAVVITQAPGGYAFRAGDPSPAGRTIGLLSMPDADTFHIEFAQSDDGDMGWDPARLRQHVHHHRVRGNEWKAKAKIQERRAERFKRSLYNALDRMTQWAVQDVESGRCLDNKEQSR